jgi:hypothetical protein
VSRSGSQDAKTKDLVVGVKGDVEKKAGKEFGVFEPVSVCPCFRVRVIALCQSNLCFSYCAGAHSGRRGEHSELVNAVSACPRSRAPHQGINYFVKIKVGDDAYIHATIWRKVSSCLVVLLHRASILLTLVSLAKVGAGGTEVTAVALGKSKEDAL